MIKERDYANSSLLAMVETYDVLVSAIFRIPKEKNTMLKYYTTESLEITHNAVPASRRHGTRHNHVGVRRGSISSPEEYIAVFKARLAHYIQLPTNSGGDINELQRPLGKKCARNIIHTESE